MPTSNVTLTPVYMDYTVVGAATWASLGSSQAAYKAAVQQCLDNISHALYLPGGARLFYVQIGLNAFATSSGDTVGGLIPGGGAATNANYIPQLPSYTTLQPKLSAISPQNSIQQLAFNTTNLPSSDHTGVGSFDVAEYLAHQLGIITVASSATIGCIGFKPATYTDTNQFGLGAGTNVYTAILHEGSEMIGRGGNYILWSWGSPGTRQTNEALSHYFALDQGSSASKIYQLGLNSGGDPYDTISAQTAFSQTVISGAVSRSSALPGMAADWQYLTGEGFILSDDVGGGQDWAGIPINSVAPQIAGPTTQGGTLSISNAGGTWTNSPTFTYQWLRDSASIGTATSSIYSTVSSDIGHSISLSLTGTGASTWLNSVATSNSIGPINSAANTSAASMSVATLGAHGR